MIGTKLGPYEIIEEIGQGGMATVYRAYHPSTDRFVAIKIIHQSISGDPKAVERFQREARLVSKLEHPHLLPIHDYDGQHVPPYIVMRYLDGGTLRDLLEREGPISLADANYIIRQVTSVLDYAHRQGVIHRDIKPSNIIIDQDGNSFLADFGIARMGSTGKALTQTGFAVGTPGYMAPEQALDLENIDARVDIYSLGVMLFEMLTGKVPYESDSPMRLILQHMNNPIPKASEVNPALPKEVDVVISKAMAKEPQERYETGEEFAAALIHLSGQITSSRAPSTLRRSAQKHAQSILKSRENRKLELTDMMKGFEVSRVELQPSIATGIPSGTQERLKESISPPSYIPTLPSRIPWWLFVVAVGMISFGAIIIFFNNLQSALSFTLIVSGVTTLLALSLWLGQSVLRKQKTPESDNPYKNILNNISRNSPSNPLHVDMQPQNTHLEILSPPSIEINLDSKVINNKGFSSNSNPDMTDLINSEISGLHDVQLTIMETAEAHLRGMSFKITKLPFSVGRVDADLNIDTDINISRRHIEISVDKGNYYITDAGSANGTYVNGKRLKAEEKSQILFGSMIRISNATMLAFVYEKSPHIPNLKGQEIDNRYKMLDLLKTSGKAAIYKAFDQKLKRDVAVKVLSPDLVLFSGYIEQFNREAETAAKLQHPHIVEIYDYGTTQISTGSNKGTQHNYIVMKLLEGGTLSGLLIRQDINFSLKQIVSWVEKLSDALDYAHRQGVIHSSIKPSAIIFDKELNPFLSDFAIATKIGDAKSNLIVGAPSYIAPEQWDDDEITQAVDQYSLAAVAYLMITGIRPFDGQDDPETRKKNFVRGCIPAHQLLIEKGRENIPEAISEVLSKSLAVNPKNRYGSVKEFAQALVDAAKLPRILRKVQPKIFISYQRDSSAGWANHFKKELEVTHKISVFVDVERLDGAVRFPVRLRRGIEECDVFVCLIAATTLDSKWVQEEIRLAHSLGKPMIPVFQESFKQPETDEILEEHIKMLLQFDGVMLFDRRNVHVDHTIGDLAKMIRRTLTD